MLSFGGRGESSLMKNEEMRQGDREEHLLCRNQGSASDGKGERERELQLGSVTPGGRGSNLRLGHIENHGIG